MLYEVILITVISNTPEGALSEFSTCLESLKVLKLNPAPN